MITFWLLVFKVKYFLTFYFNCFSYSPTNAGKWHNYPFLIHKRRVFTYLYKAFQATMLLLCQDYFEHTVGEIILYIAVTSIAEC